MAQVIKYLQVQGTEFKLQYSQKGKKKKKTV
jgi:hypothetical protein